MPSARCPTCGTPAAADAEACAACGAALGLKAQPTRISSRARDPLAGVKLGEYIVEERIGVGGMGLVYRAAHPLIGNAVAIKVLRPDVISDEADLQRFLGEAKAINHIHHPGVVSIFGAGDTPDGRKYLVMELLQGQSLEARLQRDGRIVSADAVPILVETLAALSAVHTAGVVHRDLKPANVYLARQSDGREYVKLLDFGLARRSNNLEVSRVAGTPDYISPEHARGRPPGPSADLYSFGVMTFHLLTGQLPFKGSSAAELMRQHVASPPPDAAAWEPSIPVALSRLIQRLMAKEPGQRPTAAQVKAELDAASAQLRTAQTQLAMPKVSSLRDREAPTVPAHAHAAPGSSSSDTQPQLAPEGAPTFVAGAPLSVTPIAPTPLAVLGVGETLPALPRGRARTMLLAAAGLALAAVAVDALFSAHSAEVSPEPAMREGVRPMPALSALPPEVDEAVEAPTEPPSSPPEPAKPVAAAPRREHSKVVVADPRRLKRDLRDDLRQRLVRAQKVAHERKADADESAARKYLEALERASRGELAELERRTEQIEDRLGGVKP
jgi:serine/threonine-protein kinase